MVELLEEAKTKAISTIGSLNNGFGEWYADYLLANGVVVPPCKVGDEINGEIVHQIEYAEALDSNGNVNQTKMIHTCYQEYVKSVVFASHPITWEEAEAKLKEGAE